MTGLHPVVEHHVVNTLGWPGLRPLQAAAVAPLLRGDDALLLAPTAGGKTEAAALPLLSRMAFEEWTGLSTLYVAPLRALLNDLQPRLASYASWLGRTAALRHGDTSAGDRKRLLASPPDLLLTTPESLEAMLVSTLVTPGEAFADLRAVVVDEVHAFAGDDRGWHLLAVLARLERLTGRSLQRVGLSATVGNPAELLSWLQDGSGRAGTVVAPPAATAQADLQLDYVGTVENAATVVAALHRGEKRLLFADSRRRVEELALGLREREVRAFVSHSSLSAQERRSAEREFAEGRDCVIVATSTLELGIDVGDLDRVVQVGAPRTVASLLQRVGRTGRRPGSTRNLLMLGVDDEELLRGAALLLLHSEGWVEPVVPPVAPRQVAAQQVLATVLQRGAVGRRLVVDEVAALVPPGELDAIVAWQLEQGYLDGGDLLTVGPAAEQRFGRRHFLELMSVFTSDPVVTVLHGRDVVGTVDPVALTRKVQGPRLLALAGRAWRVTAVDWKRRRAWVEAAEGATAPRWSGLGQPGSWAVLRAVRRVLLGEDPPVALTRRATTRLASLRGELAGCVDPDGTVVDPVEGRWWTWAGARANAALQDALEAVSDVVAPVTRVDDRYLRLRSGVGPGAVRSAAREAAERFGSRLESAPVVVTEDALRQLTFWELLPPELARGTVAARTADEQAVEAVLAEPLA